MEVFVGIALISLVFFIIIPGIGAFIVRNRWRGFRRRIFSDSLLPMVRYEQLYKKPVGFIGYYRFLGNLEAIQGDDTIWIRNGNISLSAELEKVYVYLLPSMSSTELEGAIEQNDEALPDEMPRRVSWSKIFSLPESTRIFLSGALYSERGQGVFRSNNRHPLTVVIYDGDQETILRRSIWGGRQRNEYWNPVTPASLITGSASLLLLSYNLFQTATMRFAALTSLTLSLTPLIPFLPPGLLFFFFYRYFWKKGRFSRAERDLIRLPLRFFDEKIIEDGMTSTFPDGKQYGIRLFHDRQNAIEAMQTGKIRETSLRTMVKNNGRFFVFGTRERDGEIDRFVKSADPMVELLLIPGDPINISNECENFARTNEVLAGLAFAIGYIINFVCLFVLLRTWLR